MNYDMVQYLNFFSVVVGIGFDALSEEVISAFIDDFLCVCLFICRPANQLLVIVGSQIFLS